MATQPPIIDDETAAFIQQFVSINLATRNRDNRPALARAAGCRLDPTRSQLTVYLSGDHNHTVLTNLRDNHTLAVVFSRPTTHRTIQFKGNDAQIVPLTAEDLPVMQAYRESFIQELAGIGYPPAFCDAIFAPLDEHYLGIRFTPARAYSQTPGPNAGKKL
jgi:hypothetical protein